MLEVSRDKSDDSLDFGNDKKSDKDVKKPKVNTSAKLKESKEDYGSDDFDDSVHASKNSPVKGLQHKISKESSSDKPLAASPKKSVVKQEEKPKNPPPKMTTLKKGESKESNVLMKSKEKGRKNDDYDEDFDEVEESVGYEPKQSTKSKPPTQRAKVDPPKAATRFTARPTLNTHTDVESGTKSAKKKRMMNRSMMSGSDNNSGFNTTSMKTYLKNQIKRNPLASFEMDIKSAKNKAKLAKKLREKAGEQKDQQSELVILCKENNLLREELKSMNRNLNKFIDFIKDLKTRNNKKSKILLINF